MSNLTPVIRLATDADIPQIQELLAYYITHSVVSFRHAPTTLESEYAQLQDLKASDLPYLVAIDAAEGADWPGADKTAVPDRILGYTNAHPFRRVKDGYAHTLELSIFVHPEAAGKGRVGPALLDALLKELRQRRTAESAPEQGRFRSLLACMSVDDQDEGRDAAIKRFYERWGFEERGRLRKVGWKFGRWIDTRYMQLDL